VIKRIKTALAERPKQVLSLDGLTPSAVTVPLFLKAEVWHVLLTRRTREVRHHKGEISFPGGAKERQIPPFWKQPSGKLRKR